MDNNVDKYFNMIVETKPTFVETKNSYERLCLYKALEKYGKEINPIYYNRKKRNLRMLFVTLECV